MHWIYLAIAATFEVAWTYSLKFMKFNELRFINWSKIFQPNFSYGTLLPLLGYIVCGIGNIYFFSLALKKVPTSTAFAIWTALTIILLKVAEVLFFKGKIAFLELFFTILIIIGIVGLKVYSTE